jgi:hypothetical protein
VSAETIIYNGKIATTVFPSFVEAIGIEGGKVSATGNSKEDEPSLGCVTLYLVFACDAAGRRRKEMASPGVG